LTDINLAVLAKARRGKLVCVFDFYQSADLQSREITASHNFNEDSTK
jgi:hypothetical protein